MTKDQEKALFIKFLEHYKYMPLGKYEFKDRPDVIFTTQAEKVIGIELTECIYSERFMKKSEYQIRFNENVISQLQDKLPFRFHLDIKLDNKKPIKQNTLKPTIDEIIKICIQEFGELTSTESKTVTRLDIGWDKDSNPLQKYFPDHNYRNLPKGITSIRMSRYDALKNSFHAGSKGGFVPDFTVENLNWILKKKNKALLNYANCDEQWLLIVEGLDFYSYFDKIKIENEFETNFDKILMYRPVSSEVIIIK